MDLLRQQGAEREGRITEPLLPVREEDAWNRRPLHESAHRDADSNEVSDWLFS
jgi:hypothetical protein